ncbi:MAG: hypothetical protein EBR33_04440 [Synechococcaceae bacterium WB4_1_0192]|nr:hypothetical protein [Synechococcaceae bacterium WB4_1_0192]
MAIPVLPLLSIERLHEGSSANPDGSGVAPLRFLVRRTDASSLSLQQALSLRFALFAGPLETAIDAPQTTELSFAPGQDSLILEQRSADPPAPAPTIAMEERSGNDQSPCLRRPARRWLRARLGGSGTRR